MWEISTKRRTTSLGHPVTHSSAEDYKTWSGQLFLLILSRVFTQTPFHSVGRGNEFMRFGRSCGMLSDKSTKNLLCVLKNARLLPNKAGACLIIKDLRYYWINYTRHNPTSPDKHIAHIKYSPLMVGGSVHLQGLLIDYFSVIEEFCYCKMLVALIYDITNKACLDVIRHPIAVEPIKSELTSIQYA